MKKEMLEKKLNNYKEDLQALTNENLLFEYNFASVEVEKFKQLSINNPDNKYLQTRFEYEKQCMIICREVIISRMGGK